jgi:hypothetical protein
MFSTSSCCPIRSVCQGKKQTYLYLRYPLFEEQWDTRGGIPMRTHCATIFADFSDYSNEADFIHGLLKKNQKKLVRSFNFTFH